MEIATVIDKLSGAAGRKGLLLLAGLCYLDPIMVRTGNGPVVELLRFDNLSARLVALGLPALVLFPVVVHLASRLLRFAVLLLRLALEWLEVSWPALSMLARGFRLGLRLPSHEDAIKAKANWEARSARLMSLALAGTATAHDVYNERARRRREEAELSDYGLAFIVFFCASLCGGPRSLAATAWSDVKALAGFYGALAVAALVAWGLLVVGLREAPAAEFERDVALGLPRSEAERATASRAA
jgi:hypothetical protein